MQLLFDREFGLAYSLYMDNNTICCSNENDNGMYHEKLSYYLLMWNFDICT